MSDDLVQEPYPDLQLSHLRYERPNFVAELDDCRDRHFSVNPACVAGAGSERLLAAECAVVSEPIGL